MDVEMLPRENDGHEYRLTFRIYEYPDPEHCGLMKMETGAWDITRDGELPSSIEEAEEWRLLAFGEWC